jgi:HEAT repeat protein
MIAGRAREQGAGLTDAALGSLILSVSREADPLWRHQAAFILGLLPGETATERLEELLADADAMTRANAAIGLARRDSLLGLPVFEEVFAAAALSPLDPHGVGNDQQAEAYFERSLLLSNSLKAVALLEPQLAGADRRRVAELLRPLTEVTRDAAIRIEVKQLFNVLSGA